MAEKSETSRASCVGIFEKISSSGGLGLVTSRTVASWPQETSSTFSEQTAARALDKAAATALQNAAGVVALQSPAASGQAVAAVAAEANTDTPAAPTQGETEQITGAFRTAPDSRDDACSAGLRGSGLLDGKMDDGGNERNRGRLTQQEGGAERDALLLVTPRAAEDTSGGNGGKPTATRRVQMRTVSSAAPGNATLNAADAVAGNDSSVPGVAAANMTDGRRVSVTASATPVKRRTYSFCEAYVMDTDRLVTKGFVGGDETRAPEGFTEEWSAAAAQVEVRRAGTAYESCTNSSTSDCCGCAGPTAEASGGDAAGVPPYLRIETLPAMLEEGSGGHICVLLGEKKEALLYSVATPFGLNRWLLVCVYMLYAFLTGCVYFGWPSMSYMLLTSGAYSWRCPRDSNGEFINDLRKSQKSGSDSVNSGDDGAGETGKKYYICDEQDAAVGPLFTIAYVTQSLMSVVAGTLLDHVSPKHAAVLGQLLNAVGWILLACSSYSFQAYIPAMVFIGLGADTAYLPTLLIAALFPGKRATVITLLGSANTASFAVPMLLEMLWKANPEWQFSRICWLYLGLGPFFCCFLAALFIPRASFGSASLRRLPLQQQQQSPLQGNKGDALLTAEETVPKKRCWRRKKRHGEICCCPFGSSDRRQQERKRFQRWDEYAGTTNPTEMYSGNCCSGVAQSWDIRKTTAFSRKQRLCHCWAIVARSSRLLLSAPSRLLQRIPAPPLWYYRTEPNNEQPDIFTVPQQEQPPLLRLDTQQSQPRNNCFWPGGVSNHSGWGGNAEENAGRGNLPTQTASARAEVSVSEAGTAARTATVASDTTAGSDVDAKIDATERRTADNAETSVFEYDTAEERSNSTTSVTQTDNTCELCVSGGCGDEKRARNWRSSQIHEKKNCRRVSVHSTANRDSDTSPTLQRQQPSFSCSFFTRFSGNEEETETVASPQHCKWYMFSRSQAQEDKRGGEKRIHALAATAPASAAVAATPGHPSAAAMEVEEDEEPSFCSQLLSSHFMCIVLYWSGMAVAISYFQSTASRLFSTKALDFMDVALSFSFIPCVLLGKMIDLFGPFPALFLVNTMGVLAYCCALAGGSQQSVLQYASILAFCVYVSVDSEQVFCYVENTFNAKHFGKLSGLALTTGGVISLVSIPLYEEVTIRLLHKNPFPVCCGLMVVLVLLYFTLGSMWFVRLKHPPAFKARKKQLGTTDAVTTYAPERACADAAVECVAADVEDGDMEEAYEDDDNGGASIAAERPGCVPGKLNYCCCCCSHESPCRASTMSDNDVNVNMQCVTVTTESGDSCRPRRLISAVHWLLKRTTYLSRTNRGGARAVEVLSQHTAERQQRLEGRRLENRQNNPHIEDV